MTKNPAKKKATLFSDKYENKVAINASFEEVIVKQAVNNKEGREIEATIMFMSPERKAVIEKQMIAKKEK